MRKPERYCLARQRSMAVQALDRSCAEQVVCRKAKRGGNMKNIAIKNIDNIDYLQYNKFIIVH